MLDLKLEFLAVVRDSAAGAAEGERGPDDGGKTDLFENAPPVFDGIRESAARLIDMDTVHRLGKELTVLGLLDRFEVRPDHFDPVAIENASFRKLNRRVEAGLPPERGEKSIRRSRAIIFSQISGVMGST